VTTTETNDLPGPETTAVIPAAPASAPEVDAAVLSAMTAYLAQFATGMHRIGFNFVRIDATSDHDELTIDATRRRFDGEDCGVRIVYTIKSAEVIPPADLPEGISPHTQALLDVWAHDGDPGPETAA
jgi:hypothetical protein